MCLYISVPQDWAVDIDPEGMDNEILELHSSNVAARMKQDIAKMPFIIQHEIPYDFGAAFDGMGSLGRRGGQLVGANR